MIPMTKAITILGIETSCDETAIALVRCAKQGDYYEFSVEHNDVYSQVKTHAKHGGVVPEVAAREHAVRLPRLLEKLAPTSKEKKALKKKVNAIAVTRGPGLVTSLLVGVEVAKTLSAAWAKPLVGVNHLEGHIYANLLSQAKSEKLAARTFTFPVLALIVSGGHTELVLMKKHLNYKIVGSTRDDAVGEAFDKSAKLLGLPYPGGPILSKIAQSGNRLAIDFPRGMVDHPNLDFSFSGLKTAVAIHLQKNKSKTEDVAASFEAAAVDVLIKKTLRAVKQCKPKTVLIAGGVAANLRLRLQMKEAMSQNFPNIYFLEPDLKFTTDNAAMIAAAGCVRFLNGHTTTSEKIEVEPRPELK
jgi:N6-L-threonylcarbamoyladenine synthase